MSPTRLGVAALVAAALAGCTAKEAPRDSARADSGLRRVPRLPRRTDIARGHAAVRRALPGALTKPIDQYTGDEFYQFVQRLRWGGGAERERQCKGNPGCSGENPARLTRVRVDAVDGQDSISAADGAGERRGLGARDQSRRPRGRPLRLQARAQPRVLRDRASRRGPEWTWRSRSWTRRRAHGDTSARHRHLQALQPPVSAGPREPRQLLHLRQLARRRLGAALEPDDVRASQEIRSGSTARPGAASPIEATAVLSTGVPGTGTRLDAPRMRVSPSLGTC